MQHYTFPPASSPQTGAERILNACARRPVDSTPIWFMRQAGRCIIEHQEMRKKYDLMTMLKTPELCVQATLMPVQAYGVDAAVIYADIMLPLEAMGVDVAITNSGPVIHNPIRTLQDVEALRIVEPEESVPYILESLRLLRSEIAGKQALIGIAGAPFTLACYLIEGQPSRDYTQAKTLMYSQPEIWAALMEKLSTVTASYLVAQIKAGADVVQLSDSWSGALSPSLYRRYVLPYTQRVFAAVKQTGQPAIHYGASTAALLEAMTEAGGDVIGIDWRMDLDAAWERIGTDHGIQGNLDPTFMVTPWPVLEEQTRDLLRRADGRPGHIFNLGHGVPYATEVDQIRRLVDTVHQLTAVQP
ncbi:uroporphyrinogen decarboxylase [Tengunoibacter tsumagoiensis]|uniref:Uroporphyrinogen decarboxylase n=1 Tax=Tengunoibacter tsumagoiensis TaxID=2014871 RepID=A0A401ZW20_9CHLR|nr:uroporphyrinogen decarboxylase [Tengunoibacter tsumagoiensis]GCE10924.1 uroporphyrinogen decarboxylase [Tengunoibacter tsumagoiensis]